MSIIVGLALSPAIVVSSRRMDAIASLGSLRRREQSVALSSFQRERDRRTFLSHLENEPPLSHRPVARAVSAEALALPERTLLHFSPFQLFRAFFLQRPNLFQRRSVGKEE
jgi:hypothetical protein